MARGICWNNKPEDTIRAAKARAKAALKDENVKLTALEQAFYEVYKMGSSA